MSWATPETIEGTRSKRMEWINSDVTRCDNLPQILRGVRYRYALQLCDVHQTVADRRRSDSQAYRFTLQAERDFRASVRPVYRNSAAKTRDLSI